jgi:dTDP-4-amino-4,6-dideoxygalactose transaminase
MSVTSKLRGAKDTVEEFWDQDVLSHCSDLACRVTVDDFLDRFRSFLGVSGRMWATTSGGDALREVLIRTWGHTGSQKKSVLLCSFNCVAVCNAVTQAGFIPETFDLADRSGKIEWDAISTQLRKGYHAVIVPHLFGVPSDFRPIRQTAAELGILLIEDCAHTLGGKIGKALAGTVGDASIFSFAYDKPISLGGGGVLLVNNTELDSLFQLPEPGISLDREKEEIKLFIAYLQDRRRQLELPTPFSRIRARIRRHLLPGGVKNQGLVPATGIGSLRAALGIWQLDHYASIREQRNQNASHFSSIPHWRAWHVSDDTSPAWLKQKIVPVEPIDVRAISQRLQARGLRVGTFNWPMTLDQYLSFPERPNAFYVATYGLDVPVHQAMDNKELELICGTLKASHPWSEIREFEH